LIEKLVMKGGFSKILYKINIYIFACYYIIYYIIYYKFYKEKTFLF